MTSETLRETTTSSSQAKLLVVEFNEINPEMILDASSKIGLPNLSRILKMQHAVTRTDDETEHQGLDPWVQWVSIHSGVSASDHGIRRLGLTAKQKLPQIWDVLGANGHTWGAWGVMNAPRGRDPNCAFFMPDPWSFEEVAHPAYINRLLALPRYAAKNYLSFDLKSVVFALFRMVHYFTPPSRWPVLMRTIVQLIDGWRTAGANVHTLTTLVDYVGVLTFVELRRRQPIDFSVIFLNHIAHLQHQFWRNDGTIDPNMKFGLKLSDKMLGLIFDSVRADEALLIANGMRQKNVAGQGWCVYRQKQPVEMLRNLGIPSVRVEQCMTHDANLIFDTDRQADEAIEILRSCVIDGSNQNLFYVEREAPTKVFYQIDIEHSVPPGAKIVSKAGSVAFNEVIGLVCERTGAHEQVGDVYFAQIDVPDRLTNHDLFDVIKKHFLSQKVHPSLRASAI